MGCLNSEKKECPKVEFLCPECGDLPPEISNIYIDNKNIEFKCKICAQKEYKTEFFYEDPQNDNIINYYCKPDSNQENKIWFKEFKNQKEVIKDKNFKKKIKAIFTSDEKKFNEAKEIIKQKNEQLKKIIEFNEKFLLESQNYKNNYFYVKSFKNICKSLENEKLRDSNDIKLLLNALNYELKKSDKAIENFFDEKHEKIERQVESIILCNKKLNSENIKCISLIKFNQLKEIILSENEITDIEPLCYISLPFLEFLDLSKNNIENIEPLGEINSKNLKYLFIQNNKIKEIQTLINPKFPTLEILRLESNIIDENSDSFQELLDLYNNNNKVLIKDKNQIDNFENNYYNDAMDEIEVEGEGREDDLILKYIFVSTNHKNKIIKLTVKKLAIEDPSILNRIQFNTLKELDLSFNKIEDISVFSSVPFTHLLSLNISFNKISKITAFEKIKFKSLKKISLFGNDSLNLDSIIIKSIIDDLLCKNINVM
jgi:hypothetical protein